MQTKTGKLPHSPEIALLIGTLFKQLGGDLTIGPDGRRYSSVPEPEIFDNLPKISALEPCYQPLNDEQHRGAMRLVSGLLHRLGKADKDFLFDLFAEAYVDPEARPI
ncbi:hypothetical protein [Sphingorhabdus sp. SMR4y]|uniref:hypothetical protein n=1 Tax=Sphingorhabdus sp. SMR4y TaxID=2584094 RepID=UPI000B5C3483|nr:hypothetical protein [Sphingorhabdus sp. SMR4y]ASK87009.1 hypothetical protein SPHFLASMR4Y_00217 [Sphingorhabdus sp. SMR4y]